MVHNLISRVVHFLVDKSTWEQLNFLRDLKCYTGQGYIFSKPLPIEDFEKILAKRRCIPQVANDSMVIEERRKFFRVRFVVELH